MVFSIGSSLLDALVLAVLSQEDAYGYLLTQRSRERMEISDSTLYPVLRRLQKNGALTAYDQPFGGRNRRYYSITPEGRKLLEGYKREWLDYKEAVEHILFGGANHDKA